MNALSIMQQFEQLTAFLGLVLDKNCEVALLDLRPEKQCITAIANGHNSGRSVGAPITDLALKIIHQNTWRELPYICNYDGLTIDHKTLISSSFFIKEQDKLLGMLCMNIASSDPANMTGVYNQMATVLKHMESLLPNAVDTLMENNAANQKENFTSNLNEMIAHSIQSVFGDLTVSAERLNQDEKLLIVQHLNQNGFFLIKGAVNELSDYLNCSEATIYRYLNKIAKQK